MSQPTTRSLQQNSFFKQIKLYKSYLFALMVISLVLLLTYARNPRYLWEPRFWAEEGTLHFAYSYAHPWYLALFAPQSGYLNFWPNFTTLIATIPPLEYAPLVTTVLALLIQLVPIFIILSSRSPLWNHWLRKLCGIGVILFVPLTNEVWLNSVNSYNYFAVITFLILIEEPIQGPLRKWLFRLLLIVGGLTGTLSCFLIPLFFLQALVEGKNKERFIQTFLLIVCAAVHLYLIFSYQAAGSIGDRFHIIGFSTIGAIMWTQSIGFLMFGLQQTSAWARPLLLLAYHDLAGFQNWGRILLIICGLFLFILSANFPIKKRLIFLSAYFILLYFPAMFSAIKDKYSLVDTSNHQRLFLAPNIILGLMLLAGVRFPKLKMFTFKNLASLLCAFVLGISIFWGIFSYSRPYDIAGFWPDWKVEVQIWKDQPNYPLRIQPAGWVVYLQKK
jgi:hypothetical protein